MQCLIHQVLDLLRSAARRGVGDGPRGLLADVELGVHEELDERRDDVGVDDGLDLRDADGDAHADDPPGARADSAPGALVHHPGIAAETASGVFGVEVGWWVLPAATLLPFEVLCGLVVGLVFEIQVDDPANVFEAARIDVCGGLDQNLLLGHLER